MQTRAALLEMLEQHARALAHDLAHALDVLEYSWLALVLPNSGHEIDILKQMSRIYFSDLSEQQMLNLLPSAQHWLLRVVTLELRLAATPSLGYLHQQFARLLQEQLSHFLSSSARPLRPWLAPAY